MFSQRSLIILGPHILHLGPWDPQEFVELVWNRFGIWTSVFGNFLARYQTFQYSMLSRFQGPEGSDLLIVPLFVQFEMPSVGNTDFDNTILDQRSLGAPSDGFGLKIIRRLDLASTLLLIRCWSIQRANGQYRDHLIGQLTIGAEDLRSGGR